MLATDGTTLDSGGITGSYIGLFFLGSAFTAISTCASSYTSNSIVAFLSAAFLCFVLYSGFEAISSLPVFQSGMDYYLQQTGMEFHYRSLSRGVLDSRDLIYFISLNIFFLFLTIKRISKKP